jgi:Stress responsive A/B Barrel Domain
MILHVLHIKFRDDVSEADREAWLDEARKMKDVTAVCVVGQKVNDQNGYTHTYCVGYEDTQGMERYLAKPGHHELVSRFTEIVEKFTTDDFSDDMDPALGDTLAKMLADWMTPKPELAAKIGSLQS